MTEMPVVAFRVYPERKSLYFQVYVWGDRDAMVEHSQKFGKRPEDKRLQAYCSPRRCFRVKPGQPDRLTPCCGEVNFYRDNIGAGTVTHEMTHAAFAWSDRVGLVREQTPWDCPSVSETEERFCRVADLLVHQFYVKAYRKGVC